MKAYKVRIRLMYPDWGEVGKMESKQREGIILASNIKKAIEKIKNFINKYSERTEEKVEYEILSLELLGQLVIDDEKSFFVLTKDPIL